MTPTKWEGDWLWLEGCEGQPLWCDCGWYLGSVMRGPDKVHRLTHSGVVIEGRAELECPHCGEKRVWRLDKKAWRA